MTKLIRLSLFLSLAISQLFTSSCSKKPEPAFEYGVEQNGGVNFFSTSSYVSSYVWDFGDGESLSSTEKNVFHNYSKNGSYLVTLTGSNKDTFKGKTYSKTISKMIEVSTCQILTATVGTGSFFSSGNSMNAYRNGSSNNVRINATNALSNDEYISITINSLPALNSTIYLASGDLDFEYRDYNGIYYSNSSTLNSTGSLTLTRNDSGILSGTFDFHGILNTSNSTDVTSGTFTVAL